MARFSGVPVGRFSGAAGAQAVSRASKIISRVRCFSMANFLPNRGILSPGVAQHLRFAPQVPASLALRLRGSPTAESRPRRTRLILIARAWRWRGASAATTCGYHTALSKTLIFRPPTQFLTRTISTATFCRVTGGIYLYCPNQDKTKDK